MAIRQVLKLKDAKTTSNLLRMSSAKTFKFSDLEVQLAGPDQLQPKPNTDELGFGKYFTDHMFKVEYQGKVKGWQKPQIVPMENIPLHPASKVLHYAVELFEGMKAYRGQDDKIRLFRPDLNMIRMNRSAERSGLPTFDVDEMIKMLCRLVQIDSEWVPHAETCSLYLRPTLIGIDPALGVISSETALLFAICSPVKTFHEDGFKPIKLLADPSYTRAWPGGCGDKKMGCNYAPAVKIQRLAIEQGLQSVLWLFGEDDQITEAGTMNMFVVLKGDNGEKELVTPPLSGLILPGIIRSCILELARKHKRTKVSERAISMVEFCKHLEKGTALEMFGVGTAAAIAPVANILYKGKMLDVPTLEQDDAEFRFYNKILCDIQYGYVEHPWGVCIDDYNKDERTI